jgi:sugar transferase (PEP-CTERM/EpsH1 system associated)
MTMTRNILYLAHRIPYPPNKGDKIRTFNEVKYLSRSCSIDLVAFADNPDDVRYKSHLERYCHSVHIILLHPFWAKIKGITAFCSGRSISEGYFFDREVLRKIGELISQRDYLAIFCFSSPMAEYVLKLLPVLTQKINPPRLLMDFCDVDSEKWAQYSRSALFPMKFIYATEARRLLKFEKKVNRIFDTSIFVSKNEAELFKILAPDSKQVVAISNGVDFDYFSSSSQENGNAEIADEREKHPLPPVILFAGAMDYHANIEGVTWFCEKILPGIKDAFPEVQFIIAGSNPHPLVRQLEEIENVIVTGFVEDIRPYYQRADLCVVPLRIARGIQNKVLEAMSMAKPVVATPVALDGICAEPEIHFIMADDADAFMSEVIELLHDPVRAKGIGIAARAFVKKEFAWDACLKKLEELL